MKLLTDDEIKKQLICLKQWDWNRETHVIEKNFTFENFTDAVCFLNQVAEIAEQEDHHPDLHLTKYRNLRIVLSTHAAKGLTKKDFIVAAKIEEVLA